MSKKKATHHPMSNRDQKKNIVLTPPKKKNVFPFIVLGSLLTAGLLTGLVMFRNSGPQSARAVPQSMQTTGTVGHDTISYPTAMFADGQARHFEFKAPDRTIRFFILQSSDGTVRAAFDACDVCWPAGKGYYQKGDNMVCANCDQQFASVLVNEVKGGCNPAPLRRTIKGDQLVLAVQDILAGNHYFKPEAEADQEGRS